MACFHMGGCFSRKEMRLMEKRKQEEYTNKLERKVHEKSDSLQAAEELSRKLTMEISVLKHEKESLLSSERIAHDEAHNLSERLGCLQRDLNKAVKELQEKHDNVRILTLERQNAMTRQEELEEQFTDALRERALSETRAAVAERKVHDKSDSLQAAEELLRKLTMEISVLKLQKESLLSSEKIAHDEAHNLSERLGCLQRDLTRAVKELQEKHDDVQNLTVERQNAMTRQEKLEEQLADALRERALAETRAAVAEQNHQPRSCVSSSS